MVCVVWVAGGRYGVSVSAPPPQAVTAVRAALQSGPAVPAASHSDWTKAQVEARPLSSILTLRLN